MCKCCHDDTNILPSLFLVFLLLKSATCADCILLPAAKLANNELPPFALTMEFVLGWVFAPVKRHPLQDFGHE